MAAVTIVSTPVSVARSYLKLTDTKGKSLTDSQLWVLAAAETQATFTSNFMSAINSFRALTNSQITVGYLEFVDRYAMTDPNVAVDGDQNLVSAIYTLIMKQPNALRGTGFYSVDFPIPAYVESKVFTNDASNPPNTYLKTGDTDVATLVTFLANHLAYRVADSGSILGGSFVLSVSDSKPITVKTISDPTRTR